MERFIDSEKAFHMLVNLSSDKPTPLAEYTRIKHLFVYDREWGVFPCDFGMHKPVMVQLLAWKMGKERISEIVCIRKSKNQPFKDYHEAADYYLDNYPSCFGNNVTANIFQKINIYKSINTKLTSLESDIFGKTINI